MKFEHVYMTHNQKRFTIMIYCTASEITSIHCISPDPLMCVTKKNSSLTLRDFEGFQFDKKPKALFCRAADECKVAAFGRLAYSFVPC